MVENRSTRLDVRTEKQVTRTLQINAERLQMEQSKPDWVFRIVVYPRVLQPLNEYQIVFNGRIQPERLLKIMLRVEADIKDAFL
jgi:hypothetical protein